MSDHNKLGLGQIIPPDAKQFKDAIHVAIAPMIAGECLKPGEHVGIEEGGKMYLATMLIEPIGIVDPFLKNITVGVGERFWLFLYPGTITSLRLILKLR